MALIISPPNAINAAYANIYRLGIQVSVLSVQAREAKPMELNSET